MSEERKPVVPVGGGVPFDPETGERYGYLPHRAARRKLVIRAQLGMPWVLGALAAAALLALAGIAFVASRPDRPGPPYRDEGPIRLYAEQDVTPLRDGSGWLDRRRGLVAVTAPAAFCPVEGGFTTSGGEIATLPVRVAGGRVYVDPTRPRPGPGPALTRCTTIWHLGEPRPADGA